MEIKKAEYISRLLQEIKDYKNFLETIREKGTNVSEYTTLELNVMQNGKYFPMSVKLKSISIIQFMNELLESRQKELKRIK